MNTLIIRHVQDSNPIAFEVQRPNGKGAPPVVVQSPVGFAVEGRPEGELAGELAWVLESFLENPFPPATARAEQVLAALHKWGRQAFDALFASSEGAGIFEEAVAEGYEKLNLQVRADVPSILRWPWEAILDPQSRHLAGQCGVERRLSLDREPLPLPAGLPTDRINILLISAEPQEANVPYRSISPSLVQSIKKQNLPASVRRLHPPTVEHLREHLETHLCDYQIIHFDGVGQGGHDRKWAEQLGVLFKENGSPILLLTSHGPSLSGRNPDEEVSMADSLLLRGVRSLVVIPYPLSPMGAELFLSSFLQTLFETGSAAAATRAGRLRMFTEREHAQPGDPILEDWLVPALYQQDPLRLSFDKKAVLPESEESKPLPEEASDEANPYGFIGRAREILQLERFLREAPSAALIHGPGGVGKTTLVRGFINWLHDTGGLGEGCAWLDFANIRTAERALNDMGSPIFGENFLLLGMEKKIEALAQRLKQNLFTFVWDNFEAAAGNPERSIAAGLSEEDWGKLLSFLELLRGTSSKVIISSRSEEGWLGDHCMRIPVGGLMGQARWEYCDAVLGNLGISTYRTDTGFTKLTDRLEGHPLAMRVILPALEKKKAGKIIEALESNIEALSLSENDPEAGLIAAIHFAADHLPERLRPLLIPLSMHEGYADASLFHMMASQLDKGWTEKQTGSVFFFLAGSGLMQSMGDTLCRLHPDFTGFLRSTFLEKISSQTTAPWGRAFVEVMSRLADTYAGKELLEKREVFQRHGANFHAALGEAGRQEMKTHQSALLQSAPGYAQDTRELGEARALFQQYAETNQERGDKEKEAAAYYQLGFIAQETRDFENARNWYQKAMDIDEADGFEEGAARTYHQLGWIAQELGDRLTARRWYEKALAIEEKQGDKQGAAGTYGQLGILAGQESQFVESGKWLVKSIQAYGECNDQKRAQKGVVNFLVFHKEASPEEKESLRTIWEEAGLGPFQV